MTPTPPVTYHWRGTLGDEELDDLHARAFGHGVVHRPWNAHLASHSLGWVTARREGHLLGFVNVPWDGDVHAFLLDTAVDPNEQSTGIGKTLVHQAVEGTRAAGCHWLHVDFSPDLESFYVAECGFRPTPAGLLAF